MELNYEKGTASTPKGHAIIYFSESLDPEKLYGTYMVVLPISVDMIKYMPPFLAPHAENLSTHELSAFAFPPIPEPVNDYQTLVSLAELRDDDLINGGEISIANPETVMNQVNTLVQQYAESYALITEDNETEASQSHSESSSTLGINDVLYELMGDKDRLVELAKLIGKLRFAVEGSDQNQVKEVETELNSLAKNLPDRYNIANIIDAAKIQTKSGGELAQLYLERCYLLADEDYSSIKAIDERIEGLGMTSDHEGLR